MAEVTDPKKRLATWNEEKVLEAGVIQLVFDASTGLEPIEGDLADFVKRTANISWEHADSSFKRMLANGYKQKVQDSVASKTLKGEYTLAERRAVMADTSERILIKCLWDKPAEGGGRGQPRYELAIKTLEANIEAIQKQAAGLAGLTPEQQANVASSMISTLKFEEKSLEEWVKIKEAKLAEKITKAEEKAPETKVEETPPPPAVEPEAPKGTTGKKGKKQD